MATDRSAILADPARRLVSDTMRDGGCSVGISQPGVSKRLRVPHDAGLAHVRADGNRRPHRFARGRPSWGKRMHALERHLDRKHGRSR